MKDALNNFMKGNYKDCEIEELSLFIDGLLPNLSFKQQDNSNQLSKPLSAVIDNKKVIAHNNNNNLTTDSVAHNDALYSENCVYCDDETIFYGYQEDGIKVYVCPNCRDKFWGKCNYSELTKDDYIEVKK